MPACFLPQSSHTAGFKQKCWALLKRLPGPAHRKGTQNVSMCNDQDVTGYFVRLLALGRPQHGLVESATNVGDKAIEAVGDVLRAPVGFQNTTSVVYRMTLRQRRPLAVASRGRACVIACAPYPRRRSSVLSREKK